MPHYSDRGRKIGQSKKGRSMGHLQHEGRFRAGDVRTYGTRSPPPGTWLGSYSATWA